MNISKDMKQAGFTIIPVNRHGIPENPVDLCTKCSPEFKEWLKTGIYWKHEN
jgi:predicted CoA-binding protein